jgi:hypothetical protein
LNTKIGATPEKNSKKFMVSEKLMKSYGFRSPKVQFKFSGALVVTLNLNNNKALTKSQVN